MTWIKIENNNLTKPPHFDETTGLANCHLNQDWLLENGYEQWSDEQVQNWYNENASAFNLACDYFRQVCEEIRILTGIEDFRGGYDDMPNFYDSPKYKTDEGVRLAAAWAGLNDLCKHEASLIGIGSPEWWHLCWDGYTLKPLPVAIYNVSGSSYDKINGDYYEEGFYNGYPYYKNKNDIIAKVNDSGLWNFYDGNTSISKTSNSYNFLEDNEYWTTIGNQETLNITKVNNGTPYFKLLNNSYSISHTEYDDKIFFYDKIADDMIITSYIDGDNSYLYSCTVEDNTDMGIISMVEEGIRVGGQYGEANALYRLIIRSAKNENIYVTFNIHVEADIREPIIITANDATVTKHIGEYLECNLYSLTNASVNRGDLLVDIIGGNLPSGVYHDMEWMYGGTYVDGEYPLVIRFTSAEDDNVYKDVTINLILEAYSGESIAKAFEYNEIFNENGATNDGLEKISGNLPKYVKVDLSSGQEYRFYAKSNEGDSYFKLLREDGSVIGETDGPDSDNENIIDYTYTPEKDETYIVCYTSYGNRSGVYREESYDSYCHYIEATITPPPVAPEQLIEAYYNSAIQSEQDASNAASQTVGIAESMQELSDKLTEVLNGQETENI